MKLWKAAVIFVFCAPGVVSAAQDQARPADQKNVYEAAANEVKRGHADAAIGLLAPLIQSNPGDYKGLTVMGMALASADKGQEAISMFEKALAARPGYPPALKGLAMSQMSLNRYEAAKAHLEQLLAAAPGDLMAHAELGEIAFAQGRFADAIHEFEQSDPLYRNEPRLLIEYARANMQAKQTAKAVAALSAIPENSDAPVHFEAGALLASLKVYEAAARQFELALPNYPDRYSAGFNLVLARVKAHEYPQAVKAGEDLIAKGYKKAELYNVLAEAYEGSGNTKQAYDSLRTATQLEPSDETNYIDLITLCLNHKNYDLASEIAGIGLERIPRSERLHLQFGVVLAMKTQFEQARKEFELAAQLAPERSLPHVALALISIQTNRASEAVQQLRNRVQQYPNDYLGLWFLGEALNRSGVAPGSPGQKEAVEALRHSVQLNPDISQSQELLGKLLARDALFDEAALHLERAVSLEPANVAALYQLAQVYSKKGETARARQLFAKVGKMKADDRENFANRGLEQILRAENP
ncbi:MAG TPA: tetratricopeptide repeat protein [Bryobacteraceae bacterium]|jgi:predicted Zn-dependent protease